MPAMVYVGHVAQPFNHTKQLVTLWLSSLLLLSLSSLLLLLLLLLLLSSSSPSSRGALSQDY